MRRGLVRQSDFLTILKLFSYEQATSKKNRHKEACREARRQEVDQEACRQEADRQEADGEACRQEVRRESRHKEADNFQKV